MAWRANTAEPHHCFRYAKTAFFNVFGVIIRETVVLGHKSSCMLLLLLLLLLITGTSLCKG